VEPSLVILTLLHLLVFVYWLGGDLGAFYSSTIITDAKQSVAARAAAAKVLANIDMAPRTALILTLPTGVSLALAKGWIETASWVAPTLWAGALLWLALAWIIHLKHLAPASPGRRLDLYVRWAVLSGLAVAAAAPALLGVELPIFLRLKLAILAAAIGLGLLIRMVLAPFGPAFAAMLKTGATAETDAAIAGALAKGRPIVIALWTLLLTAAILGLATPV
jgi:hypothetical protein